MPRALITGGTKGLGLACAHALARRGIEVLVTYAHDDNAARAVVEAARAAKLPITTARCDVTSASDIDALFAREGERGFEILIHAAGFTRDKLLMMMPESDFDAVVAVHLKGGFLTVKQAIKPMIAKRFGRVIFITSPTAQLGRAGQTNYGAAKAGLEGLCRSLAREVARFQITVNCVCAGFVETALTEGLSESQKKELVSLVPLGRAGRSDEIAESVAWLASNGTSYITGQVLGVDGGLSH